MRFLIIMFSIILSSCVSEKKETNEPKLLSYLETNNILKENEEQLIFVFHNNSCSFCVNELVNTLRTVKNVNKKINIVFFDSEIISQIDKERLYDLKENYPFFLLNSMEEKFDINKGTHGESFVIINELNSKKIIKLESDYVYYKSLIKKYGN